MVKWLDYLQNYFTNTPLFWKKKNLNVPNDTDCSSRSAVMPPAKRWFWPKGSTEPAAETSDNNKNNNNINNDMMWGIFNYQSVNTFCIKVSHLVTADKTGSPNGKLKILSS